MRAQCGHGFCYQCGGAYPCGNNDCSSRGRVVPAFDTHVLTERRNARAIAFWFCMGAHPRLGASSEVRVLSADLLHSIVALI